MGLRWEWVLTGRPVTIRFPKPSPPGKVARASPASARRMRAKAPLADHGELSRASPASTRLRGSELPSFCVLSLTQFDNPSVKNQRFLPAVHCGMTATGSHGNFDSLRGAPPFTQGSRGAPAPVRFSMAFGKTGRLPRFQRSRPYSPHFPVVFLKNLCYNNSIFAVWRQL